MQSKDCEPSKSGKSGNTSEALLLWGCSSAGRAPALQAGGQEFDSPHLHQRASEDGNDDRSPEIKWACSSGG